MPLFSENDREIFEDMIGAIEACTISTEMLFRNELIVSDYVEEAHTSGRLSLEDISQSALKFPEEWA